MANDPGDADALARARALASPLRLRILRLCLHEARTNRELAEALGINPGSMLHHVRALAETGFLRAEEPRRGKRGAREVPYRATGLSWRTPVDGKFQLLLDTFLEEIEGMDPEDLSTSRLGLKLTPEHREELLHRIQAIFQEYIDRGPDPDGAPISLFFAEHPDRQQLPPVQRTS
jgi:DNA-binding transcriptional ArsR family regulator